MLEEENNEFIGTLLISNEKNENGCVYTRECLKDLAVRFKDEKQSIYGWIIADRFSPSLTSLAFSIEDLFVEEIQQTQDTWDYALKCRCKALDTLEGRKVGPLLNFEKRNPGTFAVGMDVSIDDENVEKPDDETWIIKKCKILRVILLSANNKA